MKIQSDLITQLKQIKALADDCLQNLQVHSAPNIARKKVIHTSDTGHSPLPVRLDFGINERAFVKSHARGLSGPKKFVLILAYLAKGQVGKDVSLAEVQKRWDRMTSLLDGRFNRFYSSAAKDNGWVDTKKAGVYVLCASWKEVFGQGHG